MEPVNIMVVEDEFIIAADIRDRVENLGYHVSVLTDSGEDALKRIETTAPDLVLMDIVLQGEMDGIDTSLAIRKNTDIPIVFLTAYGSESIIERAKISEPFGYTLQLHKLNTLIKG